MVSLRSLLLKILSYVSKPKFKFLSCVKWRKPEFGVELTSARPIDGNTGRRQSAGQWVIIYVITSGSITKAPQAQIVAVVLFAITSASIQLVLLQKRRRRKLLQEYSTSLVLFAIKHDISPSTEKKILYFVQSVFLGGGS